MKFFGLIPARMESSRLPGKPLLDFFGLPMIVHVAKRAKLARSLDSVVVCTDSYKIVEACQRHGLDVCLTSAQCQNGTERVAEACRHLGLSDKDIIIDIQGDEPLLSPETIDNVASFSRDNDFEVVVPYLDLTTTDEDVNRVKLVTSGNRVVYMSRRNVPYNFINTTTMKKHLSIIGLRVPSLMKFAKLPQGELEAIEGVELLRAIENGMSVGTFQEFGDSLSVDTPADYEQAIRIIQKEPKYLEYGDA